MNIGPNEIDAAARRSEDHLRLVIDIEDRKWAETLLAGENRILEMIARGNPLPSLLDTVCRLVEEISSGSLCSILLLDPNGNRLSHGAAPSLPKSYTDAIDGRAIATCWVCDQYCSASSLLGAQQRFPSPSPPQKRRRGPGRGGRSVSPLSSSLPARSSRGKREKRARRFSCRTQLLTEPRSAHLRPSAFICGFNRFLR